MADPARGPMDIYLARVARHSLSAGVTWLGGLGLLVGLNAVDVLHWPGWAIAFVLVLGVVVAQYRTWREEYRARSEVEGDRDTIAEELARRNEREDVRLKVTAGYPERFPDGHTRKLTFHVNNQGESSTFEAEILSTVQGVSVDLFDFGPGLNFAWEGRLEETRPIGSGTRDYLHFAHYDPTRRVLRIVSPASVYTDMKAQQASTDLAVIAEKVTFWFGITDTEVKVRRNYFVCLQIGETPDSVPAVLIWPEEQAPEWADPLP